MPYLITIRTEDCEYYKYLFNEKPSEKKIKQIFFEENEIYEKSDWNNCITCNIEKIEIRDEIKKPP